MFYLVYKTTNLINGKYYIGAHQTEDKDDKYLGSGVRLRRAIRKYGKENFVREILFECSSKEDMFRIEEEMVVIDENKTYNLCVGGIGGMRKGDKLSEDVKRKIGKAHKGRKHTEEWVNNFRKSVVGRKRTEEMQKRMSDGQSGLKRGPHSEEHKRKLRESNIGQKRSDEARLRMSVSAKKRYEKRRNIVKNPTSNSSNNNPN